MDARTIDRPGAILRGTGVGMDQSIVDELIRWGYNVYFPAHLLPTTAEAQHPRLHPGAGPEVEVDLGASSLPGALAESISDRGSPLALVICARHRDVTAQLALLSRYMAPLRTAGLLVLDSSLGSRSVFPGVDAGNARSKDPDLQRLGRR